MGRGRPAGWSSPRRGFCICPPDLPHALTQSDCGISFEKVRPFLVLSERPLWWASLYSRALTTICVDEDPAPRSRPTTVRQGNGGGYNRLTRRSPQRKTSCPHWARAFAGQWGKPREVQVLNAPTHLTAYLSDIRGYTRSRVKPYLKNTVYVFMCSRVSHATYTATRAAAYLAASRGRYAATRVAA